MELHGTATDVACRPYLRLVLKDSHSEASPENQEASPEVVSVGENDQVPEPHNEEYAGGNVGTEERTALLVDDSPGLEFDVEGISLLDLSDIQVGGASEPEAGEVPDALPPQEEIVLVDQEPSPSIPSSATSEEDSAGEETPVEIDALCLDLQDAVSEEDSAQTEIATASVSVAPSANLVATLQEIDLSDLVHDDVGETGAKDAGEATTGGLDFEDTMDLSLFIGEVEPTNASSPLPPERGVEPIDLTLVDEALVDLAVDPSRKEQAASSGEAIAGLDELLMDDRSEA